MKEPQVVIRIMENHFDLGILKNVAQFPWHPDRQRIDDGTAFAGRELEQIDSVDEPVEARSLGIDGYLPDTRDVRQEIVGRLLSIYV
jgi:hypothetical protein